ncbi:uncharacterized protein PG986_013092 [Apiospora aurea]|uniref:F-box domain-containing protein n=1 Tax=Apiospora aurea TaxID=335848 RepID=A0ABR1Q1V1_9PEZI
MPSLSQLPRELSFQVFSYLTLRDTVRLSATCQEYHTHLAPAIFKTIRFTNEEAVAQSALAAVKADGQHTTRLEFTPAAGWDDEPAVPALWDEMGVGLDAFTYSENADQVAAKERKWKWRALMSDSWAALSENEHVRDLTVNELIPKSASAFRSSSFRRFLARLESATRRIWGGDCVGSSGHVFTGYVEWLWNTREGSLGLGADFLRHMRNLKRLEIHAADTGFLGGTGTHNIPLYALAPDSLPALQSLTLTNCLVGRELVEFIRGHAGVLTSLNVADCASRGDMDGSGEHSQSWATFFDEIYRNQIRACLEEECDPGIQEICRKIQADPGRDSFGYGTLYDPEGFFVRDLGMIAEAFRRGDDQRAYDRLVGLVRENAARAGF